LDNPSKTSPKIPLAQVGGENWPLELLERHVERARRLLDRGVGRVPDFVVRLADEASRRWMLKQDNPRLAEIDEVARLLGRPGAWFLNVNYEWGCTARVAPGKDGKPQLARVLDWPTPGLGRYLMAARVSHGPAPWISLTWPGYTGVLTALAPGRFAAALNQAPMEAPLGLMPVDWAINHHRLWRSPHPTPAHLLRDVFEQCDTYEEARKRLMETPLALPTFYALAGTKAGEGCIIERLQTGARTHPMPACIANDWLSSDLKGHARGAKNKGRKIGLSCARIPPDDRDFSWLTPPVLNRDTRLAALMEPSSGLLRALGVEAETSATQVFERFFDQIAAETK